MDSVVGKPWVFSDYDFLYKHFNTDGLEACAEHLERHREHVQLKAEKLGLYPSGPFTAQEIKYAKAYGSTLKGSLMFLLPGRTSAEIEELIKCAKKQ